MRFTRLLKIVIFLLMSATVVVSAGIAIKRYYFETAPGGDDLFLGLRAGMTKRAVSRAIDSDLGAFTPVLDSFSNDARDLEDIAASKISMDEFDLAVEYIKNKQRPDDQEFQKYQDADIEVIRAQLFG